MSCLAIESEVGSKPSVWAPNHSPVRPKPQITSSEIIRMSCLRQTAAIASK